MIKVKENGKNEFYESVNNQYNRMINYRTIFQMPNTRTLHILSPKKLRFWNINHFLGKIIQYELSNWKWARCGKMLREKSMRSQFFALFHWYYSNISNHHAFTFIINKSNTFHQHSLLFSIHFLNKIPNNQVIYTKQIITFPFLQFTKNANTYKKSTPNSVYMLVSLSFQW